MKRSLRSISLVLTVLVIVLGFTVSADAEECDESLLFGYFSYDHMEFQQYGAWEAVLTGFDEEFFKETPMIPTGIVVDDAGNERTVVGIDSSSYNYNPAYYDDDDDNDDYDDEDSVLVDFYIPSNIRFIRELPIQTRSVHMQDVPDLTIEDRAFYENENLIEVHFNPEGKLTIGEEAFFGCTGLIKMPLPAGADIDDSAFAGCYNLTSIENAPARLWLGYSSDEPFKLQTVSFSPGIEDIRGIDIPNGEECLTTIFFSDGVKTISGFSDLTGLTSVTLPDGILEIKDYCFSECSSLTSINLPDSITSIGREAFYQCSALTGIAKLPDSIETVGDKAFMGCSNLNMSVNHPGNSFMYQYKDSGITDITLNLSSESYITLYPGGFTGCPNLNNITVTGDAPGFKSEDGVLYVGVYNSSGNRKGWSLAKYPAGKSGGVYTIPSDAYGVGGFAFEGCKFSEIHIPVTVHVFFSDYMASIGNSQSCYAFDNMAADTTVFYVPHSYVSGCVALERYSNVATEYGPYLAITYQLNGGTNAESNPDKYRAGETITLADPVRKGYVFDGWEQEWYGEYYSISDNTLTPNNADFEAEELVLVANWKKAETSVDISAAAVTLSKTSYTYTGGSKKPAVTVTYNSKTLKENTDYSVTYSNNKNAGTAKVKITGMGKYTGTISKSFTIKPKELASSDVTLSKTRYVYNGELKKPTATVLSGTKTLTKDTDYTVKYTNNKAVGKATATVTGKGNYTGTIKKTFKIVPKATTLKSLTAGSKQFTAKWVKQATQTTGYQIQYSLKKGFTSGNKAKTVSSNTTVSKTIKNLTSGKTYYVRIRTYKTVNGKKYYSSWSKALAVKVK